MLHRSPPRAARRCANPSTLAAWASGVTMPGSWNRCGKRSANMAGPGADRPDHPREAAHPVISSRLAPADPALLHEIVVAEHDQIGPAACRDPPAAGAQPEELGRPGAAHAHRLLQRQAEHLHAVAHRRGHVECRASEHALRGLADPIPDDDGLAVEHVCGESAPTGGIASVTSSILPRALAAMATRRLVGCTWWPSTMMPHQLARSSSAAPTTPGSRLPNGVIALNRWVKPRTPASSAARVVT